MSHPSRCIDTTSGELLAAYEIGLLTPEEQTRFEVHLVECPACQEELYESAPMMAALHADPAAAAARLGAEDAAARPTAGGAARRKPRESPAGRLRGLLGILRPGAGWAGVWKPLVPVGAVAVVLLAIFLPHRGEEDWHELARLEPIPYVQLQTRAADTDQPSALFRRGMKHYLEEDYAIAAGELSASYRMRERRLSSDTEDQAALYAGLSFLLAGAADSAAVYLNHALTSPLLVIADRSRWYLAQACLLQDDPDGAIRSLEPLAADSPGYQRRAAEQLAEIRRRLEGR
jgi:hypothetical protein